MTARPDGLVLEVEATNPAKLERVQDIVAGHLERFGARDGLAVVWGSTTGWADAGVRPLHRSVASRARWPVLALAARPSEEPGSRALLPRPRKDHLPRKPGEGQEALPRGRARSFLARPRPQRRRAVEHPLPRPGHRPASRARSRGPEGRPGPSFAAHARARVRAGPLPLQARRGAGRGRGAAPEDDF